MGIVLSLVFSVDIKENTKVISLNAQEMSDFKAHVNAGDKYSLSN